MLKDSLSSPSHRIKTILFIIIICVAAFLRLFDLEHHPEGLQGDEASFLTNSQIIKATGNDEDGRPHPFFLKSLIDPKPALYSYLQIPFISLFPHHQTAASRIPGALFGIGSLIFSYFIIKKLTHNQKLALIFMALLSLSPWHINVSRATQETIMSFFFITFNFNLLLNYLKNSFKNKTSQIFTLIGFFLTSILAMYSYHSAKIFLPIFTSGYLFFLWQQKNLRQKIILIFASLIAAFIIIMLSTDTLTRFTAIGFLNNPQISIDVNNQSMAITNVLPFPIIRFLYNKATLQFFTISKNYFTYFSADFLFFFNQQPKKYAIPFQGLMLFIELPFLIYGIVLSLKQKIYWPFWWLIVAPIAGALTYQEIPSMIRVFPLIIPLIFFVSLTFDFLFKLKKNRFIIIIIVSLLYFFNWFYFFNQYWNMQPRYQPWYRNVTDELLAKKLESLKKDYKNFEIHSGLIDIYLYLFLNKNIKLTEFQENADQRLNSVFNIGKYHLYRHFCFPTTITNDTLYIFDNDCFNAIKDSTFSAALKHLDQDNITFVDQADRYYLMIDNKI